MKVNETNTLMTLLKQIKIGPTYYDSRTVYSD